MAGPSLLPSPSHFTSPFQPPYQRFAPRGDTPLYMKQLGVFLQIFNILRKKGEINFRISGIG
jgi:hypothetical protein